VGGREGVREGGRNLGGVSFPSPSPGGPPWPWKEGREGGREGGRKGGYGLKHTSPPPPTIPPTIPPFLPSSLPPFLSLVSPTGAYGHPAVVNWSVAPIVQLASLAGLDGILFLMAW
jgi:hypothetical protein